MELNDFFAKHRKLALAFSGGTDSSYLLYAALKYGADVKAYYVKSQFQPEFEYADALELARRLGAEISVIETDILSDENIRLNPENRCYYCKRRLLSLISENAFKDGYAEIMDGTNASDDAGDRPGMKALREAGVLSPLRDCGITKDELRRLSREAGIFTWCKPAYACLATRLPSGTEITPQLLRRTEKAEDFLRELGFSDFRVRCTGDCAKLQVKPEQLQLVINEREKILSFMSSLYKEVVLDLKTR